ncbi:MAG: hypothetical protein LBM60_00690 [Clostridium sp.]|jgi:hypothetical protein|nr:hypothetical protein [Clostridium sp.]
MAINRTIIVTVPSEAYVEKNSYVFVKDKNYYDPEKRYNRVKHTIIGKSIGNGQMYPNHNFRIRYPTLFEAAAGEQLPKPVKKLGFFTTVLSIAERTGLYDALIASFGIENANRIMDLAMYYIIHHSCDTADYQTVMAEQMLFMGSIWNQTNISTFFKEELTEERTDLFLRLWTGACADRNSKEAWILIKSNEGGDAPIFSFVYAIDSRNGTPLSFSVCKGGTINFKVVIEMMGWLKAYGIKVNGVILNRRYATSDVFTLLDQGEVTYVAMMEDNTRGHRAMVNQYGDKIRMKYEYMLDRSADQNRRMGVHVLFGTQSSEKIRLFSNHDYEGYACIIYDSTGAEVRQETWFTQVAGVVRSLQQTLDQRRDASSKKKDVNLPADPPDIPADYAECIRIVTEKGETTVSVNQKLVQDIGNRKSFYTFASALPITAEETAAIYTLQNYADEQFYMVSDPDMYVVASEDTAHHSAEIKAKLTVNFIAAIIRNELVKACTESNISPKNLIDELNQITMQLYGNSTYRVSHTQSAQQIKLLQACGVDPADLDVIAQIENVRIEGGEPDPHHRYPKPTGGTAGPPKGPGRPRGSRKKQELSPSVN